MNKNKPQTRQAKLATALKRNMARRKAAGSAAHHPDPEPPARRRDAQAKAGNK